MGHGNWSARDWDAYAAGSIHGRSRRELFGALGMDKAYDPARVTLRESRDSGQNPEATPIIIGVDVTGSMGMLAEELVVRGLNETFTALMDRRPVSDPHVMAMAIGDAYCDRAPLQVTQFEADLRIVEQLRQLWLEGGGGGNDGESYCLAHAFAGLKTVHDAQQRRGRKGFLFTVGDEPVLDGIERDQLVRVLGLDARRGISGREAVRLASAGYEVFHIIVDGSYAARNMAKVRASWEAILPERVIHLKDPTRLAETIVATIEAASGRPRRAAGGLAALLPEPLRRFAEGGLGGRGWGSE
ncbi:MULTISPECIES: hypothetical protein [Sphingomonadaceae]|uniref:hypothetical protein n=1 Tax=Sphingomonadaceae TaxID=41297 RepID=UPI001157D843|nr:MULTISPECIES: hypothetical protein [Sphingomonadaceae]QDK35358.1 hypothetical protein DM450_21630 [Sphingomonas sp. IC081]QSR20221.1 hypothetical protein CA833_24090 [Novosphingobium sp. KA1]